MVHVSSKDSSPSLGKSPQAAFILLESLILLGHIPLGSLVRDPRNPLGTLGPVNLVALENAIGKEHIHEMHQRHFKMQIETSKKSALGISGFVGAQLSQSKESVVQIKSPDVWR
jgi:hypothetical protein